MRAYAAAGVTTLSVDACSWPTGQRRADPATVVEALDLGGVGE